MSIRPIECEIKRGEREDESIPCLKTAEIDALKTIKRNIYEIKKLLKEEIESFVIKGELILQGDIKNEILDSDLLRSVFHIKSLRKKNLMIETKLIAFDGDPTFLIRWFSEKKLEVLLVREVIVHITF